MAMGSAAGVPVRLGRVARVGRSGPVRSALLGRSADQDLRFKLTPPPGVLMVLPLLPGTARRADKCR